MSKPKDRTLILCCGDPRGKTHARDEFKRIVNRAVCGTEVSALVWHYSAPAESAITCGRCLEWIAGKREKGATITIINGGTGLGPRLRPRY